MYFEKLKEMGLNTKYPGSIEEKTPEMAKETQTVRDKEEQDELKEGFSKNMDKAVGDDIFNKYRTNKIDIVESNTEENRNYLQPADGCNYSSVTNIDEIVSMIAMANFADPETTETLIFKNALAKFHAVDYDNADILKLRMQFPLVQGIKEETEVELLSEQVREIPPTYLEKPLSVDEGRDGLPPLPCPKEKTKTPGSIKNVNGKLTDKWINYGPSADPGRNLDMNLTTNLNAKFTCTIFENGICKPCKNLSGRIHKISSPPQ